jgi:hypothetical protein
MDWFDGRVMVRSDVCIFHLNAHTQNASLFIALLSAQIQALMLACSVLRFSPLATAGIVGATITATARFFAIRQAVRCGCARSVL